MTPQSNRPRRGRPPHLDRPKIIADAAIRLLAENGTRSLSHRRTDKEAGLPIGSTVNHAPTRNDLLLMAAQRLNDISMKELEPFSQFVELRGSTLTINDVAKEMIKLWRRRLAPDQIYRLRAEMALYMSQDFRGEIIQLFMPRVAIVTAFWQDIMARLGSKNPDDAGWQFSLWSRGLYYQLGVAGGIDRNDEARLERSITCVARALLDDSNEGLDRRPKIISLNVP